MGSIGETLRTTREAKGISLIQAEEDTKIRKRYLEALEQDDYEVIPGRVYARGFLRNYASYLGLDCEEILMEYKLISAPVREDYQKVDIEKSISKRRAANRTDRKAYLITVLIAVLAIATLVVYNFVYKNSAKNSADTGNQPPTAQQGKTGNGQAPSGSGQGKQANGAGAKSGNQAAQSGTPGTQDATPPGTPAPGANVSGVNITLNGKDQECWTRVTVDGTVKFTGNIKPGESKTFSGAGKIVITLGNAGAVEVIENGKSLGTLGALGKVVKDREFTAAPTASQGVTP